MSKRWLIIVSVGIHVGIAIGLFVSGVWHIERLEGGKAHLALGVMIPGEGPSGGGDPGEKPKDPPKKLPPKKTVPKDELRNVDKLPKPEDPKPADSTSDTPGDGTGSGSGEGPGTGEGPPGTNIGGGSGAPCLPGDPCNAPPQPQTAPPVVKTALVPPNVLAGLRISGETQIMPSDPVKTEMMRDGRDNTVGSFKVCIDTSGRVASTAIVGSTKYASYDATITERVRDWRYKPYSVDGIPVPACSVVTFRYSMK
ncbi:MAG TPA: energy transducer TonB [Kofleriaceae bacterium]